MFLNAIVNPFIHAARYDVIKNQLIAVLQRVRRQPPATADDVAVMQTDR